MVTLAISLSRVIFIERFFCSENHFNFKACIKSFKHLQPYTVISIIMSEVTKAREVKKLFLIEFSNERITEGGKLGVGTTLFFGL